jgi:type 1 fimbriae regulatory protein FimB/type 1 fimbriae regulatory protein FimE
MEGKMLMVPSLRLVAPNHIYRKVPTRRPNAEMRTREYLTPAEVEKLIAAAKLGRHGQRDATLILVAFRHGLRAVEIADLEWSQVEWGRNPALHVRRAKNGKPAVHPIRGDELRMLRELQRNTTGAFVFETERGGPFTADAVNRALI